MLRNPGEVRSQKKGAARSTVLCGDERAAPEWGMVRESANLTRGDVLQSVFVAPVVVPGSWPAGSGALLLAFPAIFSGDVLTDACRDCMVMRR